MNNTSIIRRNRNGGLYEVGKEFTEIKWMEIAEIYEKVMRENDGKCSIRKLAVEARIDKTSAHKSILFYAVGMIPSSQRRGQGDIFVIDNCTIHVKGDNEALQQILWEDHGILMITLPPYHPELNPTELVFSTLVSRMRSQRARVGSNDFLGDVNRTLDAISRRDVISFFQECGYYKYR